MQQDRGESKKSLRETWDDYKAREDKKKRSEYNKRYFAKRYAEDKKFREHRKSYKRERYKAYREARGGMRKGHRSVWTDDKISTVKSLWNKGWSASRIAEAVGAVSRCSVIGIICRENIKRDSGGTS